MNAVGVQEGDEESLAAAAAADVVVVAAAAPPSQQQQQQQPSQAQMLLATLLNASLVQEHRQEPQQQQQQQQAQPPQEVEQQQEQQPAVDNNNDHHQAMGSRGGGNNNDNTNDVHGQRMLSMQQDTTTAVPAPPPPPPPPSPPPSPPPPDPNMRLTGEEEEFALQIKEIIEMEPGLEPLSDYWYAHLALVNKDNIDAAVEQAHGLQAFCQEYDIIETVAMGRRCVEELLDDQPGFVLYMRNHPGEIPMLAEDYSRLHDGGVSSYKALRGFYYMRHSICSDFDMIRHGLSLMLECDGFNPRNFGWKDMKKYLDKLGCWYPLNLHQVRLFHSGVVMNCILSMSRRFLSPENRNKIEFGISSPMGNISNIYLLPTLQAARERIIERVVSGLRRRYANEAAFTLEY